MIPRAGVFTARDIVTIIGSSTRPLVSVPRAAKVGFKPRGKIHDAVWRRRSHVSQVIRAIACGNIHAAAECDCQVSVVAADAITLVENLPGGFGRAGVSVAKDDMFVDIVANRLNALPSVTSRRTAPKSPQIADPSCTTGCPTRKAECPRANPLSRVAGRKEPARPACQNL